MPRPSCKEFTIFQSKQISRRVITVSRSPTESLRRGGIMKTFRTWLSVAAVVAGISAVLHAQGWPQWGQNPQHSGSVATAGQSPNRVLARMTYDPFVSSEQA